MTIITKDGSLAEVDGAEALHSLRHTASHIMAQAIKHLYGGADDLGMDLSVLMELCIKGMTERTDELQL